MATDAFVGMVLVLVVCLNAAEGGYYSYDEVKRFSIAARTKVIDFLKSINSPEKAKTVAQAGILDNGQGHMVPFTNVKVYFEDPRPGGEYGKTSGYAGSQYILSTFVVTMLIENDPNRMLTVRLPGVQFLIQCETPSGLAAVESIHHYAEKPLTGADIETFFGKSDKVTKELKKLIQQYAKAFLDKVMLAPANEDARKCPAAV